MMKIIVVSVLIDSIEYVAEQTIVSQLKESLLCEKKVKGYTDIISFGKDIMVDKERIKNEHCHHYKMLKWDKRV